MEIAGVSCKICEICMILKKHHLGMGPKVHAYQHIENAMSIL